MAFITYEEDKAIVNIEQPFTNKLLVGETKVIDLTDINWEITYIAYSPPDAKSAKEIKELDISLSKKEAKYE